MAWNGYVNYVFYTFDGAVMRRDYFRYSIGFWQDGCQDKSSTTFQTVYIWALMYTPSESTHQAF